MIKMIQRTLGLCLVGIWVAGCVFAPGMNMDAGRYAEQTMEGEDYREGVVIQKISAALVQQQIKAYQASIATALPQSLHGDTEAYQYHIQAQDVLQITIWDHPELTNPAGSFSVGANTGNLVRKDGTTFYPYVGVVPVAGKTMEEIRVDLTKRLSNFVEKPQLDVRVSGFRSQLVYVTGQVGKPGYLPITDQPMTVMDAVAQSGGVITGADIQHATLMRDGYSYVLDLFSLYERGNASLNVLMRDGDVLNIPDNQLNKVFVLGEVSKPTTLFVRNGKLSLAEAISDTQGFGTKANPSQIYVIRGKRDAYGDEQQGVSVADRFDQVASLEIYYLDASSPEALLLADQFRLQSRDAVYVSPTELSRFSSVFNDVARMINTTAQTIILQRTLLK